MISPDSYQDLRCDEERALMRSICEFPEDDTPRLVYADWMDETGCALLAGHAALIRMQIKHARTPDVKGANWEEGTRIWKERQEAAMLVRVLSNNFAVYEIAGRLMGRYLVPRTRNWGLTPTGRYRSRLMWDRGFPSQIVLPSVAAWERSASLFTRVPLLICHVHGRRPLWTPARASEYPVARLQWAWTLAPKGRLSSPSDLHRQVHTWLNHGAYETERMAIDDADRAFVDAGRRACGFGTRHYARKAEAA